ncbi:MAG: M1 family metallopeptidase [Cyclobacteriaceae bacterium]|nr:M1 family metallopeptidase [Cyclobacteriaceae bacterium]
MKRSFSFLLFFFVFCQMGFAQPWKGKFEQLDYLLPTPNSYRTATGAPGPEYWQQRADYEIDVEINDNTQVLIGKESITYYNNSPEALTYLWVQLDQNINSPENSLSKTRTYTIRDSVPTRFIANALNLHEYKGGYSITLVADASGKPLHYVVNNTMMRIDLPAPLKTGQSFSFRIYWQYNINDMMKISGRSGMEYFPEDGNYIYFIAQWFPRMCVFDDYEGWQNKQFLGAGEFALTFGNYRVRITVPSDHIVAATGTLQNANAVLSKEQFERFERAKRTFDKPVFIVTEEEARKREKQRATTKVTWEYYAENVRDFAFATSRKFIWDAMAVKIGDKTPLAQSFYPKEGNPLWEQESTLAIKNTLEVYSARTFDYPYPTAISVNWVGGGMEYPMISFNGGRPAKDGTISERTRVRMVYIIVHEVGHNFFPMIVNSDERQWTWMDEGLNSFLEKETMRERYPHLNYQENTPKAIVNFMKGDKSIMRPIMASSDNQGASFGNNGYSKPAAALTILRETVMGPELFDKAFKEYARRWAFKHPKPADFFRTMEDVSGVDLDWFWRGWFYSTDHVDITLDEVKWYRVQSPSIDPERKTIQARTPVSGNTKGSGKTTDFGDGPRPLTVMNTPDVFYGEFRNRLDDNAIRQKLTGKNIYELKFKNTGGLVMPIIIQWTFADGSKEMERIPAEIWRTNENEVTKVFIKDKEVTNIVIDPNFETADVNTADNVFPRKPVESKFEQIKKGAN